MHTESQLAGAERAEHMRTVRQADAGRETYAEHEFLRFEFENAIHGNPKAVISTPGFGDKRLPAYEVLLDLLAGADAQSQANAVELVAILGQAATFGDVRERAEKLLKALSKQHADFHVDDAIEAANWGGE